MEEKNLAKRVELEDLFDDFDPDFSPQHPDNIEAARQRGWEYDVIKRAYIDEEGCLMADEYGESF